MIEEINDLSQNHLHELINLISRQRLATFEKKDDKEALIEHGKNIQLVKIITPKLAILEIALRNKLDMVLREKNENWIIECEDEMIKHCLRRIHHVNLQDDLNNLTKLNHHQYLSKMYLGEIIKIIRSYKIESKIIALKGIDFRKYHKYNRNFYFKNNEVKNKRNFNITDNVNIVLNLILTIRNRACHCENLLKVRKNINKNIIYPRITTKQKEVVIGVEPNKIEIFLDDIIKYINENLFILIR